MHGIGTVLININTYLFECGAILKCWELGSESLILNSLTFDSCVTIMPLPLILCDGLFMEITFMATPSRAEQIIHDSYFVCFMGTANMNEHHAMQK